MKNTKTFTETAVEFVATNTFDITTWRTAYRILEDRGIIRGRFTPRSTVQLYADYCLVPRVQQAAVYYLRFAQA